MVHLDCMVWMVKVGILRDLSIEEEVAAYQLVGEVMAHQGNDG